MAYFAQINSDSIVTMVTRIPDEHQDRGHEYLTNDMGLGGTWIQTSYNTRGGKHYTEVSIARTQTLMLSSYDVSGNFLSADPVTETNYVPVMSADGLSGLRYNYAGVGYTYDPVRDAFIPPQPHPSWILNDITCTWKAPKPKPVHLPSFMYVWDESTLNWTTPNWKPLSSTSSYSTSAGIN